MKNKKRVLIPLLVLLIACAIGLAWSLIDFNAINKSKSYAYEVIQFDYDGASDGVDPNGNPFNPMSFLTDDIISDGLTRSNLADKYEVENVKSYIVMEDIVPGDIVDEINSYTSVVGDSSATREITTKDYHPIRYRIILYHDLDKKLSTSELEKLLTNIVNAYCDKFYSTFKKIFDTSNYDAMYEMDNYDYIYQAEVYTNKIKILSGLAKSLYLKHEEFTAESITFNDISLKCDSLIQNDVERIKYIIMLNALSKDIDRLKDYYNYKIESLNYDKTKYTSDLTTISNQLTSYDKDSTVYVGSGENIVKVDNNSSDTYNKLLARQILISNNIAAINTEISDYQGMLDDINNAVATEGKIAVVEQYIQKLEDDYADLEETFLKMVGQYNDKYILSGNITLSDVKYRSSSILSTAFIARCFKICVPIVLVTAFGLCVYLLACNKNKRKNIN